jgi:hypothetical protein
LAEVLFLLTSILEFPLAAGGSDGLWGNVSGASILSDGTHFLYYTACSGTARYSHGTAGMHGFYDTGFCFFDVQPESNWDECSFTGRLTAAGGAFTGNYMGITASGFTVSMRNFKTAAESVDIPSVSATGFTVSIPFFSGKGRISPFCIEPFFTAGYFSCSRGTTASLGKIQPSVPCFISCGMHFVLFSDHTIIMQYGTVEPQVTDDEGKTVLSGKLSDATILYYMNVQHNNFKWSFGGGAVYAFGSCTGEFSLGSVNNLFGYLGYAAAGDFYMIAAGTGSLAEYRHMPFTFSAGLGFFFIPFEVYSEEDTCRVSTVFFPDFSVKKKTEDNSLSGKCLIPAVFSVKIAVSFGQYPGTILLRKILAVSLSLYDSNSTGGILSSDIQNGYGNMDVTLRKILFSGLSCSVQLKLR